MRIVHTALKMQLKKNFKINNIFFFFFNLNFKNFKNITLKVNFSKKLSLLNQKVWCLLFLIQLSFYIYLTIVDSKYDDSKNIENVMNKNDIYFQCIDKKNSLVRYLFYSMLKIRFVHYFWK